LSVLPVLLVLVHVLDRLCLMMPGKSKKQLQEHDAWWVEAYGSSLVLLYVLDTMCLMMPCASHVQMAKAQIQTPLDVLLGVSAAVVASQVHCCLA
jgi:hypothetical protein